MTDADQGGLPLAELAKLPPTPGLIYRGLPDDAELVTGTTITSALTTASSDPRVASDNFAHGRILAIVARKARDLSESSPHPEEGERVLLPGTVLVPVGQIKVDGMGATAQIVEEVDPGGGRVGNSALPETIDDLIDTVVRQVIKARRAEPVELTSPGKYAGAIR
jgi:hypothetical protein